jgi:hypothetical protein
LLNLGLQKPFLSINSPTHPTLTQNNTLFNLATNAAYILQILYTQGGDMEGCGGPTFTDDDWISGNSTRSRQASQAMCACLVSFFNKHLKNQDDHLLDAPTNTFPNIVQFRKKP